MVKTENINQVKISSAFQPRDWLHKKPFSKKNIWLVTYKNNKRKVLFHTRNIGLNTLFWPD